MKSRIIPKPPTVERLMKKSRSNMRKLQRKTGEDAEFLEEFAKVAYGDMVMFYNEGAAFKAAGFKEALPYLDFIAAHDDLNYDDTQPDNIPWDVHHEWCQMFYGAYCDGFNGVKRG